MARFKKPSKKTAIVAGITAAILAIVAVSGTAVYLRSRAQTEAADFDGNPATSQSVDVGTGEQNNGQETQENGQIAGTQDGNNGAAINNNGGVANDGATAAGTTTATTTAGNAGTTGTAGNAATNQGTATPNNIQEVEIVDTQTNTVTFGTDGRYLSWVPMKVQTDGIAYKTNAEIDNVKVTKTTDKQKVKINEDLTYTITVTSDKELSGVEVKDKVPEFTTFKSVENGESVKDNNGNTWVRWYVDLNENNGYKAEAKFTVTVNPEVTGKIRNAEAIANGTPIDEPVVTPVEANILFEENGGTEVKDLTDKVAGDPIENREMPTTTRQGYDFEGWFNNKELTGDKTQELPESYPAGTTTYYAKWNPRTDTKYTVEYYYQKDGKYPEEATSKDETRTGTTDTEASVTDADKTATKEGYVFDEKAENVLSGNIAGDGSLVLKVYFKEQFKVTYKPGDHGTFTEQTKSEIDYGTATPGFEGEKTGDAGYTFTGWSPEVAETVTKNAEYVAQWKANDNTKYTVEYYYQKDGKYPEKADSSDERTGTTDTEAQVTDADKTATKEGYVFDEEAENVLSGNIAGDGSLVLKVYFKEQFKVTYKPGDHGTFTEQTKSKIDYGTATPEFDGTTTGDVGYTFTGWSPEVAETVTKNAEYVAQWKANEDTKYTVEYYYQKDDGTYPESTDKKNEREGTTDATVTVTAEDKTPETVTGKTYVFDEENKSNVLNGKVAGDGSLVLKVYFKQQYKVTYKPGDHGKFDEQTKSEIDYGTATPEFEGEKTGDAGYTFTGWTPEVAETVTKNAEYVAQWKANEDTKYTVEFYYEVDGNYLTTPDSKEERTGTTDTNASVTEADKTATKDGYVFDETAKNILSGNIEGDGSLVLKVYFKQQFKVTYKPGTHGTFAEQTTNGLDYKANTPQFNGEKTGENGFYFVDWDKEVAKTVTENAEYTALWEGLEVTKTRTEVVDLGKDKEATYVDQEGDIIKYTIEVKNVGDVDAENVTLKDDHNVKVTSIKINDKEVQVQNTNIITAGNNLLEGIEATIEKDKTMVVTVEYTATKAEIDTALAGDKKILNTATATLNGHDTPATDEGTEVKQRVPYTIEYYFNGVKGHTEGGEGTVGTSVGFTSVFEGYTYIEYIGIDNQKGGTTTLTEGTNLIKVYFGKPELDIVKEVVSQKVKAGDNIEYKITVTNTGYIAAENVQVKDELQNTTFVSSTRTPEISTNATTNNQVLTWNIESVAAATDGTPGKVEFTVIAKTPRNYIGKTIENTASIVGGKSSKVSKDLEEVNVEYQEWVEGKAADKLNIIMLIDNSSSMNLSAEGKYQAQLDNPDNINDYVAVAPGDKSKTRLYAAQTAIKGFMSNQSSTDNDITVIKFNNDYYPNNYTNDTIYTLSGNGYDTEMKTDRWGNIYYTAKVGSESVNLTKGRNSLYYTGYYTDDGWNYTYYILGSDGKAYNYSSTSSMQGAALVGSTRNNTLTNNAVENMTIGDLSEGYATYVGKAFDLVPNYLDSEATNVVIVLSDGSFNDTDYATKASNLLKREGTKVDYIYSVAFGDADTGKLGEITNVYEKDEDGNNTTEKKVYIADNSTSLLDAFNAMAAEAKGKPKFDDTEEGSLELDEASKVIKITGDTKVSLTDKDTGKVYECSSEVELAKYGLHLSSDKKTITWDANEFTTNNPNETVPSNVLIKYFVGRN